MAWTDLVGSGGGGSLVAGDNFGATQFEAWRQNFIMVKQLQYNGNGTPEGVVTAPVGALYRRNNGGPGTTLYIKESGTGNTGWRAVVSSQFVPAYLGASGSAITVDLSASWNQILTLTDNCTLTFNNPEDGARYQLFLAQDTTGSRTVTWPIAMIWPGAGTPPTLSTTPADIDLIEFTYLTTPGRYLGRATLGY